MAVPVEGERAFARTATISSKDAALGDLIGAAFTKVGQDGGITVEQSQTLATGLEFTAGMQFDKGYISPYFVTDAAAMFVHPYLLIFDGRISPVADGYDRGQLQERLAIVSDGVGSSRSARPLRSSSWCANNKWPPTERAPSSIAPE